MARIEILASKGVWYNNNTHHHNAMFCCLLVGVANEKKLHPFIGGGGRVGLQYY
jgi:hypothetical protein